MKKTGCGSSKGGEPDMVGREGRFVVSIEEVIGALVDDAAEKISVQGEAIGAHKKAGIQYSAQGKF
jgi:hypothetical protein